MDSFTLFLSKHDWSSSSSALVLLLILWCVIRAVHELWRKPKNLEKQLKNTGIKGTTYRLINGDAKQNETLMAQAWSKPMPLNHAIVARVAPFWAQLLQKYGKVSLSWQRRRPRVVVADPGMAKLILNNKDGSFRQIPQNPLASLLTLGLTTLDGDEWKTRRKTITPAFTHEKVMNMLPAFKTSCSNMIYRWKEKLSSSSEGKIELEIAEQMQRLTSDVISRVAFGTTYEEGEHIFALQKEQAGLSMKVFMTMYFDWFRFLPTKTVRRMHEIDRKIKGAIRDLIQLKEKEILEGKRDGNLLSLLIQFQKQRSNEMTVDDVIEECKLFYFAGQETTSNVLTWAMILLSIHSEWQEKAREEVARVLGGSEPDFKSIAQLKTVSMILQEVMRLYPPGMALLRYTRAETQIGEMVLPAGVEVVLPIILLHHDPEIWGDDVEEFKPERFAGGAAAAAAKEEGGYFPFGWGPRSCVGRDFALMEAKLAMAMILQNFWFELSPSYAHAPFVVMTIQPQHGAPIVLHPI